MREATNPKGEKLFVLTEAEYVAVLEDAGDAALAAEAGAGPFMPADLVGQMLEGTLHPLTAWRKAMGLSMVDLAEKAGVRTASISDIENSKVDPRYSTVKALADALGVMPDDIMP